jgi:hypothetical protein
MLKSCNRYHFVLIRVCQLILTLYLTLYFEISDNFFQICHNYLLHVPSSKERFLLQICSLNKLGPRKELQRTESFLVPLSHKVITKNRSSFFIVSYICHDKKTYKRTRFIPHIWYDKKSDQKSVLCPIHLLRHKDHTKDRVFCRAFGSKVCAESRKFGLTTKKQELLFGTLCVSVSDGYKEFILKIHQSNKNDYF